MKLGWTHPTGSWTLDGSHGCQAETVAAGRCHRDQRMTMICPSRQVSSEAGKVSLLFSPRETAASLRTLLESCPSRLLHPPILPHQHHLPGYRPSSMCFLVLRMLWVRTAGRLGERGLGNCPGTYHQGHVVGKLPHQLRFEVAPIVLSFSGFGPRPRATEETAGPSSCSAGFHSGGSQPDPCLPVWQSWKGDLGMVPDVVWGSEGRRSPSGCLETARAGE